MTDNKKAIPVVCGGLYVIMLVAVILIGILILGHEPVPVGLFCVAEGLLAACLSRTPVWVHVAVFVAQIALGIFFGAALVMISMAVLYLAGVAVLFIWRS